MSRETPHFVIVGGGCFQLTGRRSPAATRSSRRAGRSRAEPAWTSSRTTRRALSSSSPPARSTENPPYSRKTREARREEAPEAPTGASVAGLEDNLRRSHRRRRRRPFRKPMSGHVENRVHSYALSVAQGPGRPFGHETTRSEPTSLRRRVSLPARRRGRHHRSPRDHVAEDHERPAGALNAPGSIVSRPVPRMGSRPDRSRNRRSRERFECRASSRRGAAASAPVGHR